MKTAFGVFIIAIGFVGLLGGLMVYGAVVGAFVLSALWGWFVTPAFGIPVPPLPIVAGLSLLIHYATGHAPTTYKDHETNGLQDTVLGMLMPWFALLIGWAIHLWTGLP